jgi:EpsI family protein
VNKLAAALGFLALNFYTYHYFATQEVKPPRESLAQFPDELESGWFCPEHIPMGEKVEVNLGVTDYLLCDFRNRDTGELANVYVGYHASQVREEGGGSGENSIHPPAHCLPGSGWDIIRNDNVPLDLPGMPQHDRTVKRLVIAKDAARQLVYYWYQSRGRVESQDWMKILSVGWDRATKHRTDGALVRFTVPLEANHESEAEATFRSLAPLVVRRLPDYVPQ